MAHVVKKFRWADYTYGSGYNVYSDGTIWYVNYNNLKKDVAGWTVRELEDFAADENDSLQKVFDESSASTPGVEVEAHVTRVVLVNGRVYTEQELDTLIVRLIDARKTLREDN